MKRFAFKRLAGNTDGIAAVEFAVLAPVILSFFGLLLDFALAFNTQLQVASAVHAAAQVAFANGQSVDTSSASTLITTVTNVATSTMGSKSATITVLVNNASDSSNAGKFYCVTAGSSLTWTSTGTSSGSCGNSLTSGKFVTITVTASQSYFFLPSTVASTIATLSDTAVVRVL